MITWMRTRPAETRLFLTFWLVYAVYVTPAGGATPNRYIDLVHAIVNEGRFAIDTYHENTIDKAFYEGHYYAGALPGPSFLAVPAYVVFKGLYAVVPAPLKTLAAGVQSYKIEKLPDSSFYGQVDNVEFFISQMFLNIFVLAPFSALGSLFVFLSLNLLGLPESKSLRATLFYAFGTIVFFYSTTYFEQVFSATLAACALYLILRNAHSPSASAFQVGIAGFVAGSGILVEYTTVFYSFWLGVLLLRRHRPGAMAYGTGFLIPVVVLMLYNYALFSNPFSSPYAYLIEVHQSVHGTGFFGATYPRIDRFLELIVGPERGLLFYMPIMLFGAAGLVYCAWRKLPHAWVAWTSLLIVTTYVVFYSAYSNWRGGSAFGPRYLIAMLPFLSMGLAFIYECLPALAVDLVGAISISINWLGAQYGFADSIAQHLQRLIAQGPVLPTFGAILSHSSANSFVHRAAQHFSLSVTLFLTVALLFSVYHLWRTLPEQRDRVRRDLPR